jgi:23S rRNA pseudouridine1911/1915/1917 synthase
VTDEDEVMLIELPDEAADDVPSGEYELTVQREQLSERLDRFLAAQLPGLSRSYVQQLIAAGHVTVDGVDRKPKFKVTPGEIVRVMVPEPISVGLEPEDIPLDVVYEDADLLVINKPAGLVVHPAPGHQSGTLVNAILHHAPGLSVGGVDRPGIVHRLDKDTSGLMVIAKSDRGLQTLAEQWADRAVLKEYVALVRGRVEPDDATIDAPIARDPNHRQKMAVLRGGREAVTHFTTRERFESTSLLDVIIDTGRTHQIRVHLAFIGHSVVGDKTYGPASSDTSGAPRQMLHASRLGFALPGGERVMFEAPLPEDMQQMIDRLRLGLESERSPA